MEFTLDLSVDRENLEDALKALISTILFYRTFGAIVPGTRDFLETPYPVIDNEEIEKEISERVGYVLNKLDHDPMSSSTTPFGSPGGSNSTNPYANITFDDDNAHQQIKEENARFAQLSIKFYDRKRVKRPSWFGKLEEDVQWETWLINVTLVPQQGKDQDQRQQFYNQLNGQVENLIFEISNKVDSHKDHIPVITSAELMPFGYTIQLVGNQGWTGFIKKLLE